MVINIEGCQPKRASYPLSKLTEFVVERTLGIGAADVVVEDFEIGADTGRSRWFGIGFAQQHFVESICLFGNELALRFRFEKIAARQCGKKQEWR